MTLMEVLIVISIIGVLVGLTLPAVNAARESSRRLTCQNHLHQISLGVILEIDAKNRLPESRFYWNDAIARDDRNWVATALPFISGGGFGGLTDTAPGTFNRQYEMYYRTCPPYFRCPSAPLPTVLVGLPERFNGPVFDDLQSETGDYKGNFGILTDMGPIDRRRGVMAVLFDSTPVIPPGALVSGRSNKLLLWESAGANEFSRSTSGEMFEKPWGFGPRRLTSLSDCGPDCEIGRPVLNHGTLRGYLMSFFGGGTGSLTQYDLANRPLLTAISQSLTSSRLTNISNEVGQPFSFHPGLVIVAYADGRVANIADTVDMNVMISQAAAVRDVIPTGD